MSSVYPIPENKRTVSAAGDDVIHLATKPPHGEKTFADCGMFTPIYVLMGMDPVVGVSRACAACFADAFVEEFTPRLTLWGASL